MASHPVLRSFRGGIPPGQTFFNKFPFLICKVGVHLHLFLMANQRKEGKKKLQVWLEETERKQLSELANAHGYGSVTAFLQAVANGEVRTASDEESQLPKSAKRAAKKS